MTITVNDHVIDVDSVDSFLLECANNMPGDYKPDSHVWGATAVALFMAKAKGTPEYDRAIEFLKEMQSSSDPDQQALAKEFLP